MIKGISEATDERGVTHYVRGLVRFVRLSKGRRRKNPTRQGHYVTRDGCRWWCTGESIPANSGATPGKAVDCMSCRVCPPEAPRPISFEGTTTGRYSSRENRVIMMCTPRSRDTKVFDSNTSSTRTTVTGRRIGRRR